jgi:prepilin-type N-terminal cleavage/methylation domain-containing protein
MSNIHKAQQGFSLIEALVAITILLIALIGPMTISSSASKSTSFSSEQVTAFFLAQEGAELAQKARDDFFLSGGNWSSFTNPSGTYGSCFASGGCDLTINTNLTGTLAVTNCGTLSCALTLNTVTNNLRARYTHSGGVATNPVFTRKITMVQDSVNTNEVKVISLVTWRTGAFRKEQKVEVETRLFNIYGN